MTHHPFSSQTLYGNNFGLLGAPVGPYDPRADLCILGVPFDLATSGRSGARLGPQAIRSASSTLRWEEQRWPWPFAAHERLQLLDLGDLPPQTGNPQALCHALEQRAASILQQGSRLLTLGGDHFISLPLLRAHVRQHGPLALIHFDAHTDTEVDPIGSINHGSMFYHACQEGLLLPEHSVQIGIRTEYTRAGHPFLVIDADQANDLALPQLSERIHQRVGGHKAYLSFDIDCLDPAFAPGTGTPVIGGLSSNRALRLVRALQGIELVGMDLVEVAPAYDHAEITALAAATLAQEFIYLQASTRQPR